MSVILKSISLCCLVTLLINACDNGPKVIHSSDSENKNSTGIFSDEHSMHQHDEHNHAAQNALHTIKVEEVLPASRYVYLKVNEEGNSYWIATGKMEVAVGETFFYEEEPLLKTNFLSKEHNRTFDKLYLVSKIVSSNHGNNTPSYQAQSSEVPKDKINSPKGTVKITELVAHPEKYSGKTILISGKCVKVNANIMGRNWLHIQDGSKDDYDLVITSSSVVPPGHVINMTGKVALNKDFGAGYKYDIILEEGQLVK